MNKLKDEELIEVEGGSLKLKGYLGAGIAGIFVFAAGFINGILRPLACSAK